MRFDALELQLLTHSAYRGLKFDNKNMTEMRLETSEDPAKEREGRRNMIKSGIRQAL